MRKFFFAAAVAVASLFCSAGSADAAFQMRIESTTIGQGVVITDEGNETGQASSWAGTANAITFVGTVGQFTLNVTTGTSTPYLAAPGFYEAIDLNNVTINSGAAGTLQLILVRSDFGAATPDGPLSFQSDVGGVLTASAGSTITFASYADDSNAIPNLGADVNPVGPLAAVTGVGAGTPASITQGFGTGAFMNSAAANFAKTGTYSVYTVVTVNFTSAGSVSFNQITGTNPAPAGLVLALTAMPVVGLGAWVRRRRA